MARRIARVITGAAGCNRVRSVLSGVADQPALYDERARRAHLWLRRHGEYDAPAGPEAAESMAVQVERGRAAGQTKSGG